MNASDTFKRVNVYIQDHIKPLVREYAAGKNLKDGAAVNEIIATYMALRANEDNAPATKKDIKRLIKRIEISQQVTERALLELLEVTAPLRHQVADKPEVLKIGRETRDRFDRLFREIRELL